MDKSWQVIHVCVKCEHELNQEEEFYSDGVCPYCGYVTESTICDTNRVIFKSNEKWWDSFFSNLVTYQTSDQFSSYWIYKNKVLSNKRSNMIIHHNKMKR